MSRKQKPFLVLLSELPWWVSLIVAGIDFVSLRWDMPAAMGNSIVGKPLAGLAVSLSVWAGVFFVGMAALLCVRELAMRPRRQLMDVTALNRVDPVLQQRPNPLLSSVRPPDHHWGHGLPAPAATRTTWSIALLPRRAHRVIRSHVRRGRSAAGPRAGDPRSTRTVHRIVRKSGAAHCLPPLT